MHREPTGKSLVGTGTTLILLLRQSFLETIIVLVGQ